MFNDYTLEDAILRPTNKPWKCPNCGIELLTREVIIAHKEQCKPKEERKVEQKSKQPFKLEHNLRKRIRFR